MSGAHNLTLLLSTSLDASSHPHRGHHSAREQFQHDFFHHHASRFRHAQGELYSARTRGEYVRFLVKIHDGLGLDLTEANAATGWFFDPDRIEHASHTLLRALWDLLVTNVMDEEQKRGLRLKFRERFEEIRARAAVEGKEEPAKLGAGDVLAVAEELGRGVRLRRVEAEREEEVGRVCAPWGAEGWITVER